MGRTGPTGSVDVPGIEHSVVELRWDVLRGALGPSDGSAGVGSNVPSALAVLRHAHLYVLFPEEIEEAFDVLERHAIRHGVLYPVALATVPFLFDMLSRGSCPPPVAERIADLLAEYASATHGLEHRLHERMVELLASHREIAGWIDRFDRAASALAIHVPGLRPAFLAVVAAATRVSAEILLALIELEQAPGRTVELAHAMLESSDADVHQRMCAAAFLARYGERTPELRTRIDAALPPSAPAALRVFVRRLWTPTVERPVVAPRLCDAEVVFAGERLVLVRAGSQNVTLPWPDSNVSRGDVLKVGVTAHGQPKLVVLTDTDGSVRVIDF